MANKKTQFTIRELTRAQMLASRKGDKELAATIQRVLASRIDRDKASHAFYAALDQGNVPRQHSILRQMRAAGYTLAPRNAAESSRVANRAAKQTFDAMPLWQRALVSFGKGDQHVAQGVKQNVVDPLLDLVTGGNRVAADKAYMRSVAPADRAIDSTLTGQAFSTLGNLSGTAPLMFIPGAGQAGLAARLALMTGEGAAYGALQPYGTNEQHTINTLAGAASGPAFAGAVKGADMIGDVLGRGVDVLRGRLAPGAMRMARKLGLPMGAGQRVRDYQAPLAADGEQPLLVQVLPNENAAVIQRRVANDARTQARMKSVQHHNNAVRMNALRRNALETPVGEEVNPISGAVTPVLERDKLAHEAQQRLSAIIDANPSRAVDSTATIAALRNAADSDNPTVKRTATQLLASLRKDAARKEQIWRDAMMTGRVPQELRNEEGHAAFLRPTAAKMDGIRQNLADVILRNSGNDRGAARRAAHALRDVESAIRGDLSEAIPGYGEALTQYARDMVPVNTGRVVAPTIEHASQRPQTASADRGVELTTADMEALNKRASKSDHGISRQAQRDIANVQRSVREQNAANEKMGGAGSNTAADQSSLMARALNLGDRGSYYLTPVGLASLAYWHGGIGAGLAGLTGGLAANAVRHAAGNRIFRNEAELVLNPSQLANALDRYAERQSANATLNRALLNVPGTIPAFAAQQALAAYRAAHPDEQPLTIDINNGTAVPASEFNP